MKQLENTITPWQQLPSVWKTQAAFWAFVRGALREPWARHPIKLEFIKQNRIQVPNPNPNGRKAMVFGMTCNRCKRDFPMPVSRVVKKRIEAATGFPYRYIEINHKQEAGSLTCKEDLGRFAANLLYVVFKDLEPLCNVCHGIVTYAQRYNVDECEAEVAKEAIAICKESATKVKGFLEKNGVIPATNATKRRKQVEQVLRQHRTAQDTEEF